MSQPKGKRKKSRLFRGVAADTLSQIVQVGIQLAMVPLLLTYWGVDLYGEWLIVSALASYLVVSDFGFAHVTARQIIMDVASGDEEKALSTSQTSSVLVGVISGAIATIFFLAVWLMPVRDVLNIDVIGKTDLLLIAGLLGAKIIVCLQGGVAGAALQAMGRYPLFYLWSTGVVLGEFLLLVIAVVSGGGPVLAATGILVANVVGFLVLLGLVDHFAPWFRYGLSRFSPKIITELAKPAIAALAFPVSQALNQQGTRLVIAAVLGPAAVALFAPHRQLAGFVSRTNVFGRSLEVELGAAYGNDDMPAFRRRSLQALQILTWVAIAAAIVTGFAAWLVFPIWTGGKLEFEPTLLLILLLVTVGDTMWRAAFLPVSAVNRHITLAKIILALNALALPAIYLFASYVGLVGVASGLAMVSLVMTGYSIANALQVTHLSMREVIGSLMQPPTIRLFRASLGG